MPPLKLAEPLMYTVRVEVWTRVRKRRESGPYRMSHSKISVVDCLHIHHASEPTERFFAICLA